MEYSFKSMHDKNDFLDIQYEYVNYVTSLHFLQLSKLLYWLPVETFVGINFRDCHGCKYVSLV